MSEICYEPSQIFQPSKARAAPSWLGPPIRLLRSCPVFDALGVGREALRLGVIVANHQPSTAGDDRSGTGVFDTSLSDFLASSVTTEPDSSTRGAGAPPGTFSG